MIRETRLIDFLASRKEQAYSGKVYRATRLGLNPTTPSTAGGRWMPRDGMAVLYTSLEREGALAEMSFHLGLLSPLPSKPIAIHMLNVEAKKVIRITREDFAALDIDPARFGEIDYRRTEAVGDTAGFLEFDAMLVPSARWQCENLVLLQDHQDISCSPELIQTETVDWMTWAKANGFISKS
jgi:hypothetical protein